MKKLGVGAVAVIIIALTLLGCATTKNYKSEILYEGAPTIVIIGGNWESDRIYLEPLKENIPGAIAIVPNRMWPISTAAKELYRQIREDEKIRGPIIVVALSWAGLPVRMMEADNPGLATMVITIGSPAGGYVALANRLFFSVGDEDSKTPLYVIAGYNNSSPRFYMVGDKNDETLGLKTVLSLGQRRVSGQWVFEGHNHMMLFNSSKVIKLVKSLINQHLAKNKGGFDEKISSSGNDYHRALSFGMCDDEVRP